MKPEKQEEHKARDENLFVDGGDLGALLRAHDWSQTSLGAVENWSDSLKTTVQILLAELKEAKLPEKTQLESELLSRHTSTDTLRSSAQAEAFRVQLTNALRPLTDANEILAIAARILGDSLGANRVIYIEVLSGDKEVIVHKNYTNAVAELSGLYHLEDFGRNLTDDHRAERTVIVPDVANSLNYTESEKARYSEIDIAAHIDVPLIKNAQFVALLAVHQATPRQWTETEVRLVEETAEQTWAAVERARAEAELRQSEARFRRIFECKMMPMGIWTIAGDIVEANDALLNLIGYTRQELETGEINWQTLTPPQYWEVDYNALREIATQGFCSSYEKVYIHKDGKQIPILVGAAPFLDDSNSGVFFAINLSDRKQAEAEREQILQREQTAREAAERANRIKDEFLAVLSHELRSPLNPILGWSKLLQQGKLDATQTQTALATIERNAQLQAQLIGDLLDISRILRGKLSLNRTSVDLNKVISAALETVRLAAEAKSLQIQTLLSSDVGTVIGDAGRLQQIVWNLLSNAVKFTNQGGQITVALTQIENHAQIQVMDTGKGINPDFLPYVFEHFRQEDGSITRQFGGLGLGLAIARQIVEMHGGQISVDSSGEGQGATFTVELPLAKTLSQLPSTESSDASTKYLNGIRILVVDDEPDSRDFIALVLELSGASVISVASGIEALTMIKQSIPDVIISDIGMPEMNGYMLLQQVRALEPVRQVLAIALTAYAGEFERQQALQAGFQKHLSKPIEPNELIQAISDLIGRNSHDSGKD
ncbi:MAG: ATP-binding protein [Waterburya sp.]